MTHDDQGFCDRINYLGGVLTSGIRRTSYQAHMGRTITLLLAFLVPFWTLAQHERTYLLELTGPADGAVTKTLHTKVLMLDPHALVSFHEGLVKVRLDEGVSAANLVQALNADGEVVHFVAVPTGHGIDQVAPAPQASNALGGPGQQEAEVQAAKAAWLLANPGMHQRPSAANSQPHE